MTPDLDGEFVEALLPTGLPNNTGALCRSQHPECPRGSRARCRCSLRASRPIRPSAARISRRSAAASFASRTSACSAPMTSGGGAVIGSGKMALTDPITGQPAGTGYLHRVGVEDLAEPAGKGRAHLHRAGWTSPEPPDHRSDLLRQHGDDHRPLQERQQLQHVPGKGHRRRLAGFSGHLQDHQGSDPGSRSRKRREPRKRRDQDRIVAVSVRTWHPIDNQRAIAA